MKEIDWPKMVIRFGSPPKCSMFSLTNRNACTTSIRPALPGISLDCVDIKPEQKSKFSTLLYHLSGEDAWILIKITENTQSKLNDNQNDVTFHQIVRSILVSIVIDKTTAMDVNHHWTRDIYLKIKKEFDLEIWVPKMWTKIKVFQTQLKHTFVE